jgi:hypothetical protein
VGSWRCGCARPRSEPGPGERSRAWHSKPPWPGTRPDQPALQHAGVKRHVRPVPPRDEPPPTRVSARPRCAIMPGDPFVRAWACLARPRAAHERGGGWGLAPNPGASRAVLQVDGTPSALRLSRCSTIQEDPAGAMCRVLVGNDLRVKKKHLLRRCALAEPERWRRVAWVEYTLCCPTLCWDIPRSCEYSVCVVPPLACW